MVPPFPPIDSLNAPLHNGAYRNFMKIYLVLILAFLIGNYLLDLVVRVLTRRGLSPDLPEEFRDLMTWRNTGARRPTSGPTWRFGDWRSTIDLAVTLAFILLGGFCVWTGLLADLGSA